jgi:hypothetical protein
MNKNQKYIFIITVLLLAILAITASINSYSHINKIIRSKNYYFNKEQYVKLLIPLSNIEQDIETNEIFAQSNELNNGKTKIELLNHTVDYVATMDVCGGCGVKRKFYIDSFHSFTSNYSKEIDFKYLIYYNPEANKAFYDPYIKSSLYEEILYVFKIDYWFKISFISFVALVMLLIFRLAMHKQNDNNNYVFFTLLGLMFSFLFSLIVVILLIISTINYSQDWYVNTNKYEALVLTIDRYEVSKSFNRESKYDLQKSKEVKYRNQYNYVFNGFYGKCYSSELNKGSIAIEVKGLKDLNLSVTGEPVFQKRIVWFRKDKKYAYLPSKRAKLQSWYVAIFSDIAQKWYLSLSFLLLIYFYLKFKSINK